MKGNGSFQGSFYDTNKTEYYDLNLPSQNDFNYDNNKLLIT